MKAIDRTRYVGFVATVLILLAASVSAEERESDPASGRNEQGQLESGRRVKEPRRWNASFVYGTTTFRGSEAHRTLGATFRIRLANRLSVESEFLYLSLPPHEDSAWGLVRRTVHSDLTVAGHVVYDFRDEATSRVVPYVMGGVGWIQTRNESTFTPSVIESSAPVFPEPLPPQSSKTDWLWFGGAFGLRVVLPRGFFVSPEVRLGGGVHGDATASAVIKMGYGF
jgi:hypothetical protein